MTHSRWLLPRPDPRDVEALSSALGIAAPAAGILVHRGLGDPAAARRFLEPSLDDLHDPLTMRDMPRAIARLREAIRDGQKTLIYGDYDVDGTTSVVLLTKAIELAGGASSYYVPHRLKDGYGMRPEVVETAAAEGVKLIVSVDTGIRAAEVVRRAGELGVDVIITDHHLPEAASEAPLAGHEKRWPAPPVAVLNPNRADCPYPEKNLCGAGVAFKLAQALLATLPWPPEKARRVSESFLKLVAIATVADVVPLTGENRIMVKYGLDGLGAVRNAGMDTAMAVIELFLTGDPARARELAQQLDGQNTERRQVEDEIRDTCERLAVDESAAALVYYAENWHRGVLGIVASRLVERLHRPVFVIGRNPEDGLAQGSGRSIAAFHLLEAMEAMPDLFVRFGGHQYAAGVTLETARVDEFRQRLNAYAAARLSPEDFLPRLDVDAVIELGDITDPAIQEVLALAPFGHGNPPPLVAALDVEVASQPVVMKEKHLRVTVRQNGRTLALKAWNFAGRAGEMPPGARVDIAFTLEEDAYSAARGYPGWAAVLRDVRAAKDYNRTFRV